RAHRGIRLEVPEPRPLRRRADDPVEGRLGADENVPDGARDRGRRAALLAGLRGPRVGGPAEVARRAAARPADPGRRARATARVTVRTRGSAHVYSGRAARIGA